MNKRRVFWRDSKGNPCKDCNSKWAPTALLAEIGKMAKINKEGGVTWSNGLLITQFRTCLRARIVAIGSDERESVEINTYTQPNWAAKRVELPIS